mmetsp:Transcript_55325/g.171390  ORF Transcript_55325/g.171390 Transcript_55325/m.171390 type:complete len:145 (+) Transcript_55325:335-769(+)
MGFADVEFATAETREPETEDPGEQERHGERNGPGGRAEDVPQSLPAANEAEPVEGPEEHGVGRARTRPARTWSTFSSKTARRSTLASSDDEVQGGAEEAGAGEEQVVVVVVVGQAAESPAEAKEECNSWSVSFKKAEVKCRATL